MSTTSQKLVKKLFESLEKESSIESLEVLMKQVQSPNRVKNRESEEEAGEEVKGRSKGPNSVNQMHC